MSSLYLHIPYCSRKCPYCDFFSQVGSQQQISAYVDLLLRHLEIISALDRYRSHPLKTIFFGGGTPSLLTIAQLNTILERINKVFALGSGVEISLEANPGTVDGDLLRGYRQAGINRLSFGAQSLNANNLKLLGRIHDVEDIYSGYRAARAAGFDNISFDLMFGLPGQSLADLEREVLDLLQLAAEHVSLYGLSYEEGTDFYRQLQGGRIEACQDDHYADQYQLIAALLTVAGYEHYEISNFSRPGKSCRHNQNYWQRRTCFALGAGAHSFNANNWGERWHVPADLNRYAHALKQGKNPARLLEEYDRDGAMREYVYLALRTRRGLDPRLFATRFRGEFQVEFAAELKRIERYIEIDAKSGCYRFNLSGWLIYDHLISYFL